MHFISQLHSTPHAPRAMSYFVPVLIGCWLVLGTQCYDHIWGCRATDRLTHESAETVLQQMTEFNGVSDSL